MTDSVCCDFCDLFSTLVWLTSSQCHATEIGLERRFSLGITKSGCCKHFIIKSIGLIVSHSNMDDLNAQSLQICMRGAMSLSL